MMTGYEAFLTKIGSLFLTIVALAIPILFACSFIFAWASFIQFLLSVAMGVDFFSLWLVIFSKD